MAQTKSFIDVSLSSQTRNPRQVFVAYSYRQYDPRDYRKCFETVGKAFSVEFVFADEQITSLHILQKIANYIRESQFGIYDITAWNPNVTLELGLALGMGERVFIGLNPDQTELDDVPSDLKGVDRIQYSSFASLEDELERLISQVLPPPRDPDAADYLSRLQDHIVGLVSDSRGLNVSTISKAVGVNIELTKLAVRNEIDGRLVMKGKTRGARYYPIEA